MKKQKKLKGILLLFVTAGIWGTAFVAQSVGLDHLGSFTFNAIRSLIGVIVLLPFICYRNRKNAAGSPPLTMWKNKTLLMGGIICGTTLCIASNLQQFGISHSTVGKSAFITTLGIVLAMIGLYMLCMKDEGFTLQTGDIYLLMCALFFSFQIISVDHFSPKVDGLMLSMMQFLVTGILSAIAMFLFEHPSIPDIKAAAFPLFYAGAFSCGIAYTLQILGQKYVAPSVASLIMSLESVIAALAGWVILHEVLSPKELLGCGFVFGAVLLTQITLPGKAPEPEL